MTPDLAATSLWLAILALASLVEIAVLAAIGIFGYRLYRRAAAVLDRAESAYVAPLTAKLTVVADEAQAVVRRAQRMEERLNGVVARAEELASRLGSVAQHAWPVVGTWRAVTAALGAFRAGGHGGSRMRPVA